MCLFQLWFSQSICLVVGLLGHMIVLFLIFRGISILCFMLSVSVYIPSTVQEGSFFSTPSPEFIICIFYRWWPFRSDGHHQLDGYEFDQALGVGDGQGKLACCSLWGHKESDTTEKLNWTDSNQWWSFIEVLICISLIMSFLEHFFLCLLAVCKSSLKKMSILVFFLLIFDCVVCFSHNELQELLVYYGDEPIVSCFICSYIFPFWELPFQVVYSFLKAVQKCLSLTRSHLFIFDFISIILRGKLDMEQQTGSK